MITWSDLVLPPINLWTLPSQPNLRRKEMPRMDDANADLAAQHEEMARNKAIDGIRRQAASIDTSNPTGLCWTCGDYIGHGRRWCDADCRDAKKED